MKTSRWLLGALLVGGFVALEGCGGAGQYVIPNVEPVVKPKPEDDLLEDIEGGSKPAESSATPSGAKPADDSKPAADTAKGPAPAKK
jgi:hypothetical protein